MNIFELSFEELTEALIKLGLQKYRAKQIWTAVYCFGARDFSDITALNKETRELLGKHFSLERPVVSVLQKSADGTQKWLLKNKDNSEIECVFIPEEDRGALCVSTQVGCLMGCKFCNTGTQGFVRNLSAGEIVSQIIAVKDTLNDWVAADNRQLSNIVLMGMGEPLYNYDNTAKAVRNIMRDDGIGIGKRRITLSTCGVVPMIERCGQELEVNLAVSLHAVTDELRDELIPINKKYPIKELLKACKNYPAASNSRRITFEYVMLKGVNDSMADAKELIRLLRGIHAKINLIPFNEWSGSPYQSSDWKVIEKFGDVLNEAGYASPIRTPRGRDIMAACGQLRSQSVE
ncbi:MAG: 23S rRNA (adenine(2503)-C(2))-methyltransferase RlmN [Alphaproteobacteria bacterium]|nr:23S rRNA (adenine(2503)-C(2))-methyltransferase RlmN [Alphaproteobacteria bacterium]MCL2504674.1 23S rRNA (adenine(2503)-C(2))-methyltransferase RlmN [Alphaproteobacteria bacterium]